MQFTGRPYAAHLSALTAGLLLACGGDGVLHVPADGAPGDVATASASATTRPAVSPSSVPGDSATAAATSADARPPVSSGIASVSPSAPRPPGQQPAQGAEVQWGFDGTAWRSFGTPPACPTPLMLGTPVRLNGATSVLYPGQARGGHYKAHGGFRFDAQTTNAVDVSAPVAGLLVEGGRYLERGEVQHLIDLIAPCGIKIRFDHLRTLTPDVAALFASFPPPAEGDSRTSRFARPLAVVSGQRIATEVGLAAGPNVFVDFGVYDLRQRNEASRDPAWLAQHADSQAPYAVCWLDWLGPDSAAVRALPPADGSAGATSDYCR